MATRGRGITHDDLVELIDTFQSHAHRVDRQPAYAADAAALAAWTDHTRTPTVEPDYLPEYLDWLDGLAATGRTLHRLRIIDEPPTDWQRWVAWASQGPAAHGERIVHVRKHAIPGLDHEGDWWLFDGHALVDIDHTPGGHPTGHRLHTDPDLIRARLQWWETAAQQEIPHPWPTRSSPSTSPPPEDSPTGYGG